MTTRVQLVPGWLLLSRPYRESSLLLEVFTAEHGRVGLVARGARGKRSRWRGALEPFRPLLLSWQDRGDLGTLTGAEAAGAPVPLQGEALFRGWYVNELLYRLLQRRDPYPALLEALATVLAQLSGPDHESALRAFELTLLDELGYGLHLPASVDPAARYEFDPEGGARPARAASGTAISGASLLALAERRFDSPQARRDARNILRLALTQLMAPASLRTPEMLRSLRRATGTAGPVHA